MGFGNTRTMLTKRCSKCGIAKSLDSFYKSMRNGLRKCKACQYAMCKANVQAHPEREMLRRMQPKNKAYMRNYKLVRNYNITVDEYNEMFTAQMGLCAICGLPSSKRLCVDHDHKTGHIRNLLCRVCNNTVGWLEADPIRAYNAVDYVETWKRAQQ